MWRCTECRSDIPADADAVIDDMACNTCGYNVATITERTRSSDDASGFTVTHRRGCIQCETVTTTWCGHDFRHWPPSNIEDATYSWLLIPLIYDAVGIPRHGSWTFSDSELPDAWSDCVAEYRDAFRRAGIDSAWIRRRLNGPAHLPGATQNYLIKLCHSEINGQGEVPAPQAGNFLLQYGAGAAIAARDRAAAANRSSPAQPPSPSAAARTSGARVQLAPELKEN